MSHVTGGQPGPYAYRPQQQPRRRGVMPLVFGGLTLLVGTPLAFLLPVAIGMGDLFGALLNPASDGDTRYLPANEDRVLYAMGEGGESLAHDACSVTGPSGEKLELHPQLVDHPQDPQHFWTFHTQGAGDHTLRCGDGSVMAVAPGDALEGIMGWTVGAFLLALLVFLLGMGLIIWGITQLVRTNRRAAAVPPGGHGPYGPHGPGGMGGPGGAPYGGDPHAPRTGSAPGQAPTGQPPAQGAVWNPVSAPPAPGATSGEAAAPQPDPRQPHPLTGLQGRPAPEYGQYAPGHGPDGSAPEAGDGAPQGGSDPAGGAHRL